MLQTVNVHFFPTNQYIYPHISPNLKNVKTIKDVMTFQRLVGREEVKILFIYIGRHVVSFAPRVTRTLHNQRVCCHRQG